MEYAEHLRRVFAEYARASAGAFMVQPIYTDIDDTRRVSYNGTHYTLFLLPSDPKPSFQDANVKELGCGNLRAWVVPYDYAEHQLRIQQRKLATAVVATPQAKPYDEFERLYFLLQSAKQQIVAPWVILGVDRLAAPDTIKSACHKLLLICHPDKNSDPRARSVFDMVQSACNAMAQK